MTRVIPTTDGETDYADVARVCDRLLTPVIVIDPDSTLRYANGAAARLVETGQGRLKGLKMLEFVHPDDRERVTAELAAVVNERPSGGFTRFRVRGPKTTGWRVFDSYAHNLVDDPDIRGVLVSGGDVTEQDNLATAMRALTKSNHVLMHATDESSLMTTICDSIIESGRHTLAWVGYAEYDAAKSVRLVAASGSAACVADTTVSWGRGERGEGPTGRAIRTGAIQIVRDVPRSKRCAPWSKEIAALGSRTACSIPLNVDDDVIGALTIYSPDPTAFDAGEVELLRELADNLSFGISRLRHADQLARSEAHLREAERLAHVGHWEWDLDTQRLAFKAEEMSNIYGVAPDWRGDVEDFLHFVPEPERASVRATLDRAVEEGCAEVVHHVRRSGGSDRVVHMRAETIAGRGQGPGRILGVSIDITDQMEARRELEHSRQFHLAIADNMAEGMIATDKDGTITFANAAAGRLVGVHAAELVGQATPSVLRFRESESGVSDAGALDEVWTRGRSIKVDYDVIARNDGTSVPVAYSASPLIVDGLQGAVIVFEDITHRAAEQLRVERELEKLSWVGRVRDALDMNRLVLFSQPIIDLATMKTVQNELLLRMVSPSGDIVAPNQFLPAAEEYGLIAEIDRWVIGEATRLAALGQRVEFNLSAKSVTDPRFLDVIRGALEVSGAPAQNLVCEITETALVQDLPAAGNFVRGLNALGCRVALDDFGAGYGGFSYLKHLPVSYLKIDREFVRDISDEISSQYVVSAVVNLARAFGMLTVAEGVESDDVVELLKGLGVDYAQGYSIGRPAPLT